MDIPRVRSLLQSFEFQRLFIEELGWSRPVASAVETVAANGETFQLSQIAELSGVVVLEVASPNGLIPDAAVRAAVHRAVAAAYLENLLVFVDSRRTQSLWYWVKRDGHKRFPREHLYVQGQPGDLFISKISGIVFDISRFDAAGRVPIVEVADALRRALDVERVTRRFYEQFRDQQLAFTELIEGIADEREQRWYASVLLNRLMFLYFLQCKGFVDRG